MFAQTGSYFAPPGVTIPPPRSIEWYQLCSATRCRRLSGSDVTVRSPRSRAARGPRVAAAAALGVGDPDGQVVDDHGPGRHDDDRTDPSGTAARTSDLDPDSGRSEEHTSELQSRR